MCCAKSLLEGWVKRKARISVVAAFCCLSFGSPFLKDLLIDFKKLYILPYMDSLGSGLSLFKKVVAIHEMALSTAPATSDSSCHGRLCSPRQMLIAKHATSLTFLDASNPSR